MKEQLWGLQTLPIEFRWGVTYPLPKTGSRSDEPLRSYADDAVLEGSASTGRLAPNRALSLCTKVAPTVDCLWTKFGRCGSNGSGVITKIVNGAIRSIWFRRMKCKNRCCARTACRVASKFGEALRIFRRPNLFLFPPLYFVRFSFCYGFSARIRGREIRFFQKNFTIICLLFYTVCMSFKTVGRFVRVLRRSE